MASTLATLFYSLYARSSCSPTLQNSHHKILLPCVTLETFKKNTWNHDQCFGMCVSINKKLQLQAWQILYYSKPSINFVGKKHREKIRNTGKTQGKHREFYLGWNVATLTTENRKSVFIHPLPKVIENRFSVFSCPPIDFNPKLLVL